MIHIKTKEEIQIMEEGAKILAQIMEELKRKVEPGITTKELDKVAQDLIFKFGAKPSFKGYNGFPATLCVSVNEEIVHGIPSERRLKEGDIVSLDLGLFYKGFHSDMAITLGVGKISPEASRLIRVTKDALRMAIRKVRPGNTIGDIGNTIQRYVESQGFNVVRDLCGHGIGRELHEEPQILNYGKRHTGAMIREGMVFCIEPMVTMGDWKIKKSQDGFTFLTKDGSLSAHFEHEVAVGEDGCKVLTKI
ncbi:type I methionyl aminopeptidase [bacterium]|nr:type I methionyl aminopeptidase [bacterium]